MTIVKVSSQQRVELIDITAQVGQVLRASGVEDGLMTVFTPHTTAAITINENADPDVPLDLIMELNKIVPFEDNYAHGEGNSAAHLKSSLIGASETVIVTAGAPLLGTWQGIYFCEFDGPRQRQVHIKVLAG